MRGKAMVPAIRFAGFTDAWEQRKYGDVIELLSGQDFEPSQYNEVGDGIPYMTGASCIVNGSTIEYRWTLVPRCIAYQGEVLLVCKGSGYGTLARLGQEKAHIARQFMDLRCTDVLNNTFNYYLAFSVVKEIKKNARGLIAGIDRSAILKQAVSIPQLAEQEKIGQYFSYLDHLITLHQRKYSRLCNIKKSMLERMFPKEGASVPEIRFAGFTDAWEQRKLGEVGQTYTGLAGKTKEDFGHGQARFVTYMNVFSNPISNPDMTEPIEVDPSQNEVEIGDVFFTTSSETPEEVGMSSVLLEKRGKTYLNSFCFGFRPTEKFDNYFLAYMLRSEPTRGKIILLAQGISRYNISKNKVMEIAVSVPSLGEQRYIGQYFRHLDHLITLHQRKLERLQNIKKSCLEKMFV
jgi:type I restriction enzyme S subunit